MAKAKKSGGASRRRSLAAKKSEASQIPWRFLLNAFLAVAVAVLLVWSIYRLEPLAIIQQYTNKPIAHVSVQGDFKYVSQVNIEALVATKLTETFLELDIVALKSHLEKHPWIDRAIVTRQWPDTLLIKISEQQPIARWNSHDFLNLRGEIVNLDNKTELNHLPLLRANDRYAEKVMQQYVLVAKLLANYKFAPLVLELDNTLAWSLRISPEIEIKLGREDSLKKLQRLMDVLTAELNDQVSNIDAIDMRYKQGFAINWIEPPETSKAEAAVH